MVGLQNTLFGRAGEINYDGLPVAKSSSLAVKVEYGFGKGITN